MSAHPLTEPAVLISGGGIDTWVLGHMLAASGLPLHLICFDYGQVSFAGQRFGTSKLGRALRRRFNAEVQCVYPDISEHMRSLLGPRAADIAQLSGAAPIPRTFESVEEELQDAGGLANSKTFGFTPGRNGMFLYHAAIYAACRGLYRVYWAQQSSLRSFKETRWGEDHYGDDQWFPFLEKLNRWLPNAIGLPVEVVVPLWFQSKLENMRLGVALGMGVEDFENTWSCEHANRCGVCPQCQEFIELYPRLYLNDTPTWWHPMLARRERRILELTAEE